MTALLAAFAFFAVCVVVAHKIGKGDGYKAGRSAGYLVGVDAGWNQAVCDRLNRDAARDRARRNGIGQFKEAGK